MQIFSHKMFTKCFKYYKMFINCVLCSVEYAFKYFSEAIWICRCKKGLYAQVNGWHSSTWLYCSCHQPFHMNSTKIAYRPSWAIQFWRCKTGLYAEVNRWHASTWLICSCHQPFIINSTKYSYQSSWVIHFCSCCCKMRLYHHVKRWHTSTALD